MFKNVSLFLFAALGIVMVTSCSSDSDGYTSVEEILPTVTPIQLSDTQRELVVSNNDFAFDLFRQSVSPETSGMISPIGATFVLGMANEAATGETRAEIIRSLGFGTNAEALTDFCKTLIKQVPKTDTSVSVKIANAVVVSDQYTPKTAYVAKMKDTYDALVISLDLTQPSSINYINAWCSKQTEGAIPTIVDDDDAHFDVLLLNSLCFEGGWTEKFDKADTRTETFTAETGETVDLPLMHRTAIAQYASNDVLSAVTLPYGGGNWQMIVLLPAEDKTLSDVKAWLSADSWTELKTSLVRREVDIKLPRFTTATTTDLLEPLRRTGILRLFTAEAEMPNMLEETGVFVQKVLQKTFIDVNEERTQVRTVTKAEVGVTSPGPAQPADFHANRPFIYLITEGSTGAVFFIGTYTGL